MNKGNNNNIWEKKYQIGFNQLNPEGKMHLFALFDLIQEAAWLHAEEIGFGYKFVTKHQKSFVLYQTDFKIIRPPECNESITVKTWASDINNLFAEREFLILNLKGEILVQVSSQWLLIDNIKRRIIKPNILQSFNYSVVKHKLLDQKKIRIPKSNLSKIRAIQHKVNYSEIDINGHTNSGRYTEWIQNILEERFKLNPTSSFNICFMHETHLNDEIQISLYQNKETYFIEGKNCNTVCFRASLKE
ncbi:MAG: acyl-[acyl-carrier-protein] thioesterase [Bacteroidales bacterium]